MSWPWHPGINWKKTGQQNDMAFLDYKGTFSRNSWISPEHDSSWEQRNPSGKVVIGNHCRVTNQLKFTPLWNSLPWNPKVFRLDHVRWNVLPSKKCMWMLYGNLKSVAPFCLFWNARGLRGRDTRKGSLRVPWQIGLPIDSNWFFKFSRLQVGGLLSSAHWFFSLQAPKTWKLNLKIASTYLH